jgi:hypothetical protein
MDTHAESQTQTSTLWQRTTTRRFLVWLSSRRTLLRLVFIVAAFATLIGLFYGEENWRGRRAWNKYKQQLEAQGQQLDWAAVIPKPVPDDQNFAATPFLRLIINERGDSPEINKRWPKDFGKASDEFYKLQPKKKSKQEPPRGPERRMTDLVTWQAAFMQINGQDISALPKAQEADAAARTQAAKAVLDFLKPYEPVLEELRQASSRPACRYDVNYDVENPFSILLPHLARQKVMCQLLRVRASAELAAGEPEKAYRDVLLALRLAQGLKDEPILISYLVQIAGFRITTDAIWEGLAQHTWSDAQLQAFQKQLQEFDFLANLESSFKSERAWGLKYIDYLRKHNITDEFENAVDKEDQAGFYAFFRLAPGGWLDFEKRNYAEMFPLSKELLHDRRIDPSACVKKQEDLVASFGGMKQRLLGHRMISALILPALTKVHFKAAEAQTVADESVTACALERCRLANGQFPDQLQALVPKFLDKVPQDVISGNPLIYRRTDNGQYVLYSVALNGKDDGGLVALKQSITNAHDWVWRSQPKQ